MALRTKIFSFLLLAVLHERAGTGRYRFWKTVFWSASGNGLKRYFLVVWHGTSCFQGRHIDGWYCYCIHWFSHRLYILKHPSANDDSVLYRELCRMDRPKLRRLLGNACYELLVKFLSDKNDSLLNDPQFLQLSPQYYITKAVKRIRTEDDQCGCIFISLQREMISRCTHSTHLKCVPWWLKESAQATTGR